jgi:hypothetical protein
MAGEARPGSACRSQGARFGWPLDTWHGPNIKGPSGLGLPASRIGGAKRAKPHSGKFAKRVDFRLMSTIRHTIGKRPAAHMSIHLM